MPNSATTHRWAEPAALAELHACRTLEDLDRAFLAGVQSLLPGVAAAICLVDDVPGRFRVATSSGVECPLHGRAFAVTADWPLCDDQRLPIRYRTHFLGELWLGPAPSGEELQLLHSALAHYGTALVNLTLNREARQATEDYCASLQALEEGIVLFQEEDPAAITARILCLATSMAQSAAGALYVLEEVGNPASELRLEQVLGIPDSLIAEFRSVDGRPWPGCLLEAPPQLAERRPDGSLAELAPECVPPILQQMIVLPLRYHGVVAGLCLLLNPTEDGKHSRDHLGRLQSLGQLAAALLHRLHLEEQSASNHSIQRDRFDGTPADRWCPLTAPSGNPTLKTC